MARWFRLAFRAGVFPFSQSSLLSALSLVESATDSVGREGAAQQPDLFDRAPLPSLIRCCVWRASRGAYAATDQNRRGSLAPSNSRHFLLRRWMSGLRLLSIGSSSPALAAETRVIRTPFELVQRADDDPRLALLELQDPEAASNRHDDVPELIGLPPGSDLFGPFSYDPIALSVFASSLTTTT